MSSWVASSLPEIRAIVLFGSRARGDSDNDSDVDIAVFADASSPRSLVALKDQISAHSARPAPNYSVYSLLTSRRMAAEGSLFLWHLRLEGDVRFQRNGWLDSLWDELSPYSVAKARRDIGTFETAIQDVMDSLRGGSGTLAFEASTIYSVLRSMGMIVSMLEGRPTFARLEPIVRLRQVMGGSFGLSPDELNVLGSARLSYSRGAELRQPALGGGDCLSIAERVANIIDFTRLMLERP